MAEEKKTVMDSKEVVVKEHSGKDEVCVDFEGTTQSSAPAKVLIEEDSYLGVVVSVDLIKSASYDNKNVVVDKVVFAIRLDDEGVTDAELAMFVNPIIKKSSGTSGYSNSKLYDLLEKSGDLEAAKAQGDRIKKLVGLLEFLQATYVGRKCKALVKTTNKGTDKQYSSVGNIVRFVGKVEPAEKEAEK